MPHVIDEVLAYYGFGLDIDAGAYRHLDGSGIALEAFKDKSPMGVVRSYLSRKTGSYISMLGQIKI